MDGKQVNMVIVRENTECLVRSLSACSAPVLTLPRMQYVKQEKMETLPDGSKKAIAIRQITERASSRIGRMAFELALKRAEERAANPGGSFWQVRRGLPQDSSPFLTDIFAYKQGPPKVTIIHKSNVLSVTDGLFRETVRAVKEKDASNRYASVDLEEQIVDSMVYR